MPLIPSKYGNFTGATAKDDNRFDAIEEKILDQQPPVYMTVVAGYGSSYVGGVKDRWTPLNVGEATYIALPAGHPVFDRLYADPKPATPAPTTGAAAQADPAQKRNIYLLQVRIEVNFLLTKENSTIQTKSIK